MAERSGQQPKRTVIGERLRASREQRGITLDEAAARTKIHASVLEALESGEMVQRLGAFYAKGFLKKYGTFLGVDVQPWLEDLSHAPQPAPNRAAAPATTAATAAKQAVTPPTTPHPAPHRWSIPWEIDWGWARRAAAPAAITLVVSLGAVWVAKSSASAWHKNRATRTAQTSRATVAQPSTKPKPEPRPRSATAQPTRTAPLVKAGIPLTLTVLPKRDVWMRVRADEKIIFQNVLTVGTAERWRAEERFDLWVGDADALTLDLNGHDLGSPGKGVQKNIVITRDGLRMRP